MSSFIRPRQALFVLTSSSRQTPRPCYFSSTSRVCEEDAENEQTENVKVRVNPGRSDTGTFEGWIRTEGEKWRYPDTLGPKWLGGNVPFPDNPTFKPPVPLSDKLRTKIYDSYVDNPAANDFHVLSTRYGVSIARIQAIIRLKELEVEWKKSKPLQTGFLTGMERLLAINVGGREQSVVEEIQSTDRSDVNEADELSRQESRQNERRRTLSRTFFEMVDEGEEAIVPRLLSERRERAATTKAKRKLEVSTTVVKNNPSKPPFKFIDVGLRWFDPKDAERRQKESLRRKAIKYAKKSLKPNTASISTVPS